VVAGLFFAWFAHGVFKAYAPPATKPHSRYIPNDVKVAASVRDSGVCAHCGGTDRLAFDHIIPYSKGGASDDVSNIQLLCRRCNTRKGNRYTG
jgi:5-methylcytosine-specific restriction endonuclease McrA